MGQCLCSHNQPHVELELLVPTALSDLPSPQLSPPLEPTLHHPDESRFIRVYEIPFFLFSQEMYDVLAQLGKYCPPELTPAGVSIYDCFEDPETNTYYQGEWHNGLPGGQGQMVSSQSGTITYWEGYFSEGLANGHVRAVFQDGSYYSGQMTNHQMHDLQGCLVRKDFTVKGAFRDDLPHGHVLITYSSGNRYDGEVRLGAREGYGQFSWQNEQYQGLWRHNQRQGQGLQIWKDGRRYDGLWEDDMMHGQGVFVWPSGITFRGTYRKDQRHGDGMVEWPGGDSWHGRFFKGHQHGWAKVTREEEVRFGLWQGGCFQGWHPDIPHLHGIDSLHLKRLLKGGETPKESAVKKEPLTGSAMTRMAEELLELDIKHGLRVREVRKERTTLFTMMREDLSEVLREEEEGTKPAPSPTPFDLLQGISQLSEYV